MITIYLLGILFLGSIGWYLMRLLKLAKLPPLPPGPKPLPLIGNVLDMPPHGCKEWLHWLKHKDEYGPISSVTAAGNTIIILNEARMAFDLFEKRGSQYSARPRMVMGAELGGWNRLVTMKSNPIEVRAHRKRINHHIGSTQALASFYPQQDSQINQFLLSVLAKPSDLLELVRSLVGANILQITYGYKVKPAGHDCLIELAEAIGERFNKAIEPGLWLVDSFPFLKHVPKWMPGAEFKRKAEAWRKLLTALAEKPYAFVRHQMAAGTHKPSFVSKQIEQAGGVMSPQEEHEIIWTAGVLYGAGADTTVSAISAFFLAMALHPEAQRKAQTELDRVVGCRMPAPEDRKNLVYIEAVIKEVLRWNPVAPVGVPHTTTEDDFYEGYRIPQGATLIPNIWAFMHDPQTYPDPMAFKPERFLECDGHAPELDPHKMAFGFGRRTCPGRFLADSNLYLTIARSLILFHIRKPVVNGQVMEPPEDFQPGIVSQPTPFELDIRPRSAEHESLLLSSSEQAKSEGHSALLEKIWSMQ
ncbi:cytochrome P450 oxidoreductase OrdA-like protein [Aspergillus steynii IBT 23096]|uniref:Cytochrome P450 oxidoreductase OrdA-like protein n=1 Tax=Aspergillus steynii IBT 23096 TaxID=1392250 RepID=A0A2I2FZQ6_9EURO|nr:cytochrome P450 oxidoreductase OrdA-like protein [Aspergillus steynii IBT 23096]PLB46101.1 cytochrome P450 oxidoreductase OrdA-like protein [Aspergillus steynii IBT 23096]